MSDSRRTRLACLLVALAPALASCCCCEEKRDPPPPAAAQAEFDYFRVKAEELGRDRARVVAFVRDGVTTLPYRGDVKGPLGALWGGAASPEEKAALAAALLAHCVTRTAATMAEVAPGSELVAGVIPRLSVTIAHRLLTAGGAKETRIFEGPIGALVGDVHSIEVAGGKTRFVLRAKPPVSKEVDASGAIGEEVLFAVERPGDAPLVVTRELWHAGNRVGAAGAGDGDRHDFVVLPCRITPYVREKEEMLLRVRHRDAAPEAAPYLGLLDYTLESDRALDEVEKSLGVTAELELPRILILSSFGAKAASFLPWQAIDLRLDRTSFAGDEARAGLAALSRSFVESGLEQYFLEEWSDRLSTSGFDNFGHFRADLADTRGRRITAIAAAIDRLPSCGEGAKVSFGARAGAGGAAGKSIVATRGDDGKIHVSGGSADATFAGAAAAAPAIDDLVEADLSEEAALDERIDRGAETLVVPGSRFLLRWREGEDRVEQTITVNECGAGLSYRWRVKAGPWPASGTRALGDRAVADSAVHNPWYRAGPSAQATVTSFIVSRRVERALRAGTPCDFALMGRAEPGADEGAARPQERGTLALVGRAAQSVTVNGRPDSVPILQASFGERKLAVLDDPLFPVGMADALVEVSTSIRGRLLDEEGRGISDAEVTIGIGGSGMARTWDDGSFRLPPAPPEGYGKSKLRITRRGRILGDVDADLQAPGRAEIVVRVTRPKTALAWIGRANRADLDALDVSPQVKRHAARDIDAGCIVAIPDHMIDGPDGQAAIAYYALDESGWAAATQEDGLRGANVPMHARVLSPARGQPPVAAAAPAPSWWMKTPFNEHGSSHERLLQEIRTDLLRWGSGPAPLDGFGSPTKDALRAKLGAALVHGKLADGLEPARTAFRIGYLAATRLLGHEPAEGK